MPTIASIINNQDPEQYLWRASSKAVNEVVEKILDENSLAFNMGLYARKWSLFAVKTQRDENLLKCPSSGDNIFTDEKFGRESDKTKSLLKQADNLGQIVDCFKLNGSKHQKFLRRSHHRQERILTTLNHLGWKTFRFSLSMRSPLVHGLGETHPLEKFLTFDRNTGIPYLPSSSIKGILKVRCMICKINQYDKEKLSNVVDENGSRLINKEKDSINENFSLFQELFGTGEVGKEIGATQGKLIIFDAFPVQVPKLKREIMTPHFSKYYQVESLERRGPTESQSPVPNAYLAIDSLEGKQQFCFSFAASPSLKEGQLSEFLNVFSSEEVLDFGFGAKTSIGMGQFEMVENLEAWTPPAPPKTKLELLQERIPSLVEWGSFKEFLNDLQANVAQDKLTPTFANLLISQFKQLKHPKKVMQNTELMNERKKTIEDTLRYFGEKTMSDNLGEPTEIKEEEITSDKPKSLAKQKDQVEQGIFNWPRNNKKKLIGWIKKTENLEKLTDSELKQLKLEVEKTLKNRGTDLVAIINQRLQNSMND